MDGFFAEDKYHMPCICKKCGGVLVFEGVGEYKCEDCGSVEYDDYGKVRAFIENHKGATAAQVEAVTGVSQRTIRQMLKDGRLEVTSDSKSFLRCESCGKTIRSGILCPECEMNAHRMLEAQQREKSTKNRDMQGFGTARQAESGQRRFSRKNG